MAGFRPEIRNYARLALEDDSSLWVRIPRSSEMLQLQKVVFSGNRHDAGLLSQPIGVTNDAMMKFTSF